MRIETKVLSIELPLEVGREFASLLNSMDGENEAQKIENLIRAFRASVNYQNCPFYLYQCPKCRSLARSCV